MELYALLHTEKNILMSIETTSNSGRAFCNDSSYELVLYGDNIWAVNDLNIAKKASIANESWYNSDYFKPMNSYAGLLKVVKLTVEEINED